MSSHNHDIPLQGELPAPAWVTDPKVLPKVSVVIPTLNEGAYIEACIQAILAQDYPKENLEILVVDGVSNDGLEQIVQQSFIEKEEPVSLHSNPRGKTPISLNIGIKASTGDIVVILGAHTEIFPAFIKKNVENLRRPEVVCSGGTQVNAGRTRKQIAIGAAMSHRFGIATAPYRHQVHPGYVNTVVYGAYRREIFEQVGYFEEEGTISEDAELNWRIIQTGYEIYFDPSIKTRYYPRATFSAFARQMYRYGTLRAYMFRKHFEGLSVLHFIPSTIIILLLFLAIGSPFDIIPFLVLICLIGAYSISALISSFAAKRQHNKAHPVFIMLAFYIMHIAWGLGFMVGLISRKTSFKQYISYKNRLKDSE